MASTAYVAATELGQYGMVGVPPIFIERASSLVDSLLYRPEGLTYTPDANGWPCYMTRLTPRLTLNIAAPIPHGSAVVVPLIGNIDTNPDQLIGEVMILDRATSALMEAVVILSATANSITLQTVINDHPGPVTADFGLVVTELKSLPEGRPVAHLSAWPIARIHSGVGRYGFGRHGADPYGIQQDQNLIGILRSFGGAPLWQAFPLASSSWDPLTGHVWVPAGNWLAYYNEVQIRYVSGWSQSNLPERIKQAVATLAVAMQTNLLPGNITSYKAGDTQIVRAASTILDADTQRYLKTFNAHQFA